MNKKANKQETKNDIKVFDRSAILDICKPVESAIVPVEGWNGGVKMKNIDFAEFSRLLKDSGENEADRSAMLVAAVCEELDLKDAYKLQKGNAIMFAPLLAAVDSFLKHKVTDEKIKK